MSHGHHHHVDPDAGDRRVALAVIVNLALTVAQVIGGVLAGSLSLIADALHNFSDAISLVIAFGARKIARRPANSDMTFGYGRAEVVAALINYTTLIVIGLYLVYEAVLRFFEPEPVVGWMIVVIAGIALVIDVVTALLTFSMAKSSVNIRAAFLHNVADALGSIGVIIAGTLIILFGWQIVDPLVTLMIAGYILWQAFSEIGGVIRVLMLGSPPDTASEDVVDAVRVVDGVTDVHHTHIWMMGEHETALDAHLVIAEGAWTRADAIKADVKAMLAERFGIDHATLELECAAHPCVDRRVFGHGDPADHAHDGPPAAHAHG
ncbi:cation diffusion facilitator family transporter [Acuticoccus sp. M5D2P5]|uniref:cation diffusion facilitator family transporter n=1 Tax=Acuticoccus kalidii TaxID=2910977 RepID=UPI001F2C1AB5|nr:cation diffusion facilitator family transporter [Acuticoccus kalidii]MCF3936021.1 cation diffusion facilitator family transporter [Acuticoccus kalidii]